MKISRDGMSYGHTIEFNSVEEAICDALIPNPHSYEGQLEKFKVENEKLREVVSRLIEVIFWRYNGRLDLNDAEKLGYILGCGYEVEE